MSYIVQQLVLGILVDIYQIILFLILPFGYNCFCLIYCSWKYTLKSANTLSILRGYLSSYQSTTKNTNIVEN